MAGGAARAPVINVMEKACRLAARGLVRDFGEVEHLQVSRKGPADFVSAADLQAEKILREELTKARPSHGLLMEESGARAGDDGHRWIVDPLDGTLNFLHGVPHFAISIGLEKDGEIIAAMIYQPVTDELFWAQKGAGAFLNDRRLRVSARDDLSSAVIATGMPFMQKGDHSKFLKQLEPVMRATAGVRRFGAAALDLAYVAAGRFDGYWENGLNAWDIAAGILLVREAGGFVTEIDGGPNMLKSGDVLATNSLLHPRLKALVNGGG